MKCDLCCKNRKTKPIDLTLLLCDTCQDNLIHKFKWQGSFLSGILLPTEEEIKK